MCLQKKDSSLGSSVAGTTGRKRRGKDVPTKEPVILFNPGLMLAKFSLPVSLLFFFTLVSLGSLAKLEFIHLCKKKTH